MVECHQFLICRLIHARDQYRRMTYIAYGQNSCVNTWHDWWTRNWKYNIPSFAQQCFQIDCLTLPTYSPATLCLCMKANVLLKILKMRFSLKNPNLSPISTFCEVTPLAAASGETELDLVTTVSKISSSDFVLYWWASHVFFLTALPVGFSGSKVCVDLTGSYPWDFQQTVWNVCQVCNDKQITKQLA